MITNKEIYDYLDASMNNIISNSTILSNENELKYIMKLLHYNDIPNHKNANYINFNMFDSIINLFNITPNNDCDLKIQDNSLIINNITKVYEILYKILYESQNENDIKLILSPESYVYNIMVEDIILYMTTVESNNQFIHTNFNFNNIFRVIINTIDYPLLDIFLSYDKIIDRIKFWHSLSLEKREEVFNMLKEPHDVSLNNKLSKQNIKLGIQMLMENNFPLNKWFDKSHNNNNFELPNNLIDNMPYVNKVQTKEGVKRMITFDKNLLTSNGSNNLQYIQMNAQNMTFNDSSINIFDTSANFSTFLICNKSNSEKPIYFHNYDPSKEQLDSSDIPKYPQKRDYTITDNYTRDSFLNITTPAHCEIGSLGTALDTNYSKQINDYSISDIFFTTQESEYKHNIYPESECWDDATTIQIIPKRAGSCCFNSEGNYTRPSIHTAGWKTNFKVMYRDLNYYTVFNNLDDKKYKRVDGTDNLYYNQFLNYEDYGNISNNNPIPHHRSINDINLNNRNSDADGKYDLNIKWGQRTEINTSDSAYYTVIQNDNDPFVTYNNSGINNRGSLQFGEPYFIDENDNNKLPQNPDYLYDGDVFRNRLSLQSSNSHALRMYHMFIVIQHPFDINKDCDKDFIRFGNYNMRYGEIINGEPHIFSIHYGSSNYIRVKSDSNTTYPANKPILLNYNWLGPPCKNKITMLAEQTKWMANTEEHGGPNIWPKENDNPNKAHYNVRVNGEDKVVTTNFAIGSTGSPYHGSSYIVNFGWGLRASPQFVKGLVGEFIIYDDLLTEEEINNITGYLIDKWNIKNSSNSRPSPSNHTYPYNIHRLEVSRSRIAWLDSTNIIGYDVHHDRVLKFDPSFNFTLGLSKEGLREKYIIDNSLDNINITIDTKTSMAISDFMFISDKLSQDERIEIYRYFRNKRNVGQGEIDRYKVNSLITDNSYNFPNRINTKNKLLFWFDSDDIYNLNIQDNLKIEFIVKIFLELETINDIIYFIQNILPSHFDEMLDKIKNNSVYLNNFINLLKNTKLVNNDFIYSDNFIELTRNLYIITDLLSLNKDDTNNDIVGYNYNKEKKIGTYCYIDNTDISFVKDIVDNTYTLLLDISCCADNFEIDVSNINYVKNNVINSVNDFNITDESIREDFRNLSVFQQKSLLYYALKDDYNKRIVNILYYSNPNINDYSYNVYIFKDKSPNNINIETNCNEQSTRHSKFKLIDDYSLNELNLPINRRLVIDGGSDGLLYRNNLIDKTNHNMFTQSIYIVARLRVDWESGKTTLMEYDTETSRYIRESTDNIQYTVTLYRKNMHFNSYMGGTTWPGAYVFKSSGSDDNFYTVTGDDANFDPYKITDTSNESQNINFDNYIASGEVIVPNPNVFKGNKYLNSEDISNRFDHRFAYFDEGKRLRSDEDTWHMPRWDSGTNRVINNRKGSGYYSYYDWEPDKANLFEFTIDSRRKYVEAHSSNYESEKTSGYLGENGFSRYSINSGSSSSVRNSLYNAFIIPDETDWNNPNYHNSRHFIEFPNAGFTSIGNNYDICELIITNQPFLVHH